MTLLLADHWNPTLESGVKMSLLCSVQVSEQSNWLQLATIGHFYAAYETRLLLLALFSSERKKNRLMSMCLPSNFLRVWCHNSSVVVPIMTLNLSGANKEVILLSMAAICTTKVDFLCLDVSDLKISVIMRFRYIKTPRILSCYSLKMLNLK